MTTPDIHIPEETHEYVADYYRPSRCVNCGERREHAMHQTIPEITIPDIHIPEETVWAAARAAYNKMIFLLGAPVKREWDDLHASTRNEWFMVASTTLRVALENWPGMRRGYNEKGPHWRTLSEFNSEPTEGFILPLTEKQK